MTLRSLSRKAGGGGVIAIVAIAVTGCCGFVEPSPELRSVLRYAPPPEGPCIRAKVRVKIDSPWIAGTFDGVLVARTGDSPIIRMQLFPELGPKALDLVASPSNVTGYFPHKGQGDDHSLPLESIPTPIDGLGITLVEHFTTLGEERALGMRETKEGWTLQIQPAVKDLKLEGRITKEGRVLSRSFRYSWLVRWTQEVHPDGGFSINAGKLSLRLSIKETKTIQSLPDKIFMLRLPEGTVPFDR